MNVIIANKYKDMLLSMDIPVIKSMEGVFDVNDIIENFSNFYFDRMILDITAIKDYNNLDNLQKISINLDMNKVILVLDDSEESTSSSYLSKLISMGIYNFTRNVDGINYLLQNPNSYRDVAHIHNMNLEGGYSEDISGSSQRIIGIKSLTDGAGATTMSYMIKKNLETNYSVCAIEVDKRDFSYFDDKDMVSTTSMDLPKELMKRRDYNIIIIDLNNYSDPDICNNVLCLVEPSILKLNKMIKRDRRIFEKYTNDKIVLNQSYISDSELADFEYEAKCKVYANIPSLNDRDNYHEEINNLLGKLGFTKQVKSESKESTKDKLFNIFK